MNPPNPSTHESSNSCSYLPPPPDCLRTRPRRSTPTKCTASALQSAAAAGNNNDDEEEESSPRLRRGGFAAAPLQSPNPLPLLSLLRMFWARSRGERECEWRGERGAGRRRRRRNSCRLRFFFFFLFSWVSSGFRLLLLVLLACSLRHFFSFRVFRFTLSFPSRLLSGFWVSVCSE